MTQVPVRRPDVPSILAEAGGADGSRRPALGPDEAAAFLAAERAVLLREFPDGMVTETYRTVLQVVGT